MLDISNYQLGRRGPRPEMAYISVPAAIAAVIPDEERALVAQRGQRYSAEQWWWGRRARLWFEIARASGVDCTREDVYAALSGDSGIPKRTLRDYADVVGFYVDTDPQAAEEYEQLPFAHFRVARRFGPRYRQVLERAQQYLDAHGRLPSAEWLEFQFSAQAAERDQQAATVAAAAEQLAEIAPDELEELPWVAAPPPAAVASVGTTLTLQYLLRLERALAAFEAALVRLPLSPAAKAGLGAALTQFITACQAALAEVGHPAPPFGRG